MTWGILKNNRVDISLFEIADKLDRGGIYVQESFDLNGTELIDEIRDMAWEAICRLVESITEYPSYFKKKPQKGKSTYYFKRTPQDSRLNINKTISEQFNLLRVVDNEQYPAFFEYGGREYILKIYRKYK